MSHCFTALQWLSGTAALCHAEIPRVLLLDASSLWVCEGGFWPRFRCDLLLACDQDTETVLRAIASDPRETLLSAPQRNPVSVARWSLTSAKNNPTVRAVMRDLLLFPRPMLGDIPGSACTKYASQSVTAIMCLCNYCPAAQPNLGSSGRLCRQAAKPTAGQTAVLHSPWHFWLLSMLWMSYHRHYWGDTEMDECAVAALILEWERSHSALSASMSQGHSCLQSKWTGFLVQIWCMQHQGFCRAPADGSVALI